MENSRIATASSSGKIFLGGANRRKKWLQECSFGKQVKHALRAEFKSKGIKISEVYLDSAARDLIAGHRMESPVLSAILAHPKIKVQLDRKTGELFVFAAKANKEAVRLCRNAFSWEPHSRSHQLDEGVPKTEPPMAWPVGKPWPFGQWWERE
jgi:hypothetical protein